MTAPAPDVTPKTPGSDSAELSTTALRLMARTPSILPMRRMSRVRSESAMASSRSRRTHDASMSGAPYFSQ